MAEVHRSRPWLSTRKLLQLVNEPLAGYIPDATTGRARRRADRDGSTGLADIAGTVRLAAGYLIGQQVVALSDAKTGAVIRRLLPGTTAAGMRVSGLALDPAGELWITYSKGPDFGGHVAGGDPHPHICANEIDVVHAGTGRVTVFLRTGDNVLISRATPSPDGRRLVYTETACTGFFDSYLRVTDLRSGHSWTIGQQLPDCHLLTSPAWSADGRTLLVAYGPPSQAAYSGQPGTCVQWYAGRLVRVTAGAGQPGLAGPVVRADRGCQITSVAATAHGGMLTIEACGSAPEYLDGPARLLVMTTRGGAIGHTDQRLPILQPAGPARPGDATLGVPRRCAPPDHRHHRREQRTRMLAWK